MPLLSKETNKKQALIVTQEGCLHCVSKRISMGITRSLEYASKEIAEFFLEVFIDRLAKVKG